MGATAASGRATASLRIETQSRPSTRPATTAADHPRPTRAALAEFGPGSGSVRLAPAYAAMRTALAPISQATARLDLQTTLKIEHRLARMLDYGVIAPRLQALYDWSARELDIPEIRNGSPTYAWSYADRNVWRQSAGVATRPATPSRDVATVSTV